MMLNFVTAMFILDTYNKARKAANLQNDEDQTVGTEVSDIDHRRKRKRNPKYFIESTEDECNLHYNVKKSCTSNQLLSDDSENEETLEEDLQAKVATLLSKKNSRKPKVPQDKEISMVMKYKDLINTHDSKKDYLVDVNNITESHSHTKIIHKQTGAAAHAVTEAIIPMSFPNTSGMIGNNVQQSESALLFTPIIQNVQKENSKVIITSADNAYKSISQELCQSTYLNKEHSEITPISSSEHSKENRSHDANYNNSFRTFVSSSKNQSTNKVKTELLQEISSKLDFVMMNTTKILTHLAPEESLLLRPNNLPALPLKSVNEYETFEEFLNNSTNFSAVVQYFVGRTISQGNDWQCAMYLVSKLLINNKLARAISWGGTKDTKISLSNSKIMEAVYCAVLKNHPKSDLKLVKTKVQRWLYTGNQRKV
ncbi:uncharacterized protein LOC116846249 isoform X2 [Odontomachus brunneus]|uniref:uncharacterized protein LOC116846249 isoform X2 n=1 Tax=Odontomachus brunneus TaxID=486640 RepID=UPI0013F23CBF|nr:uncharacterized protein LOC116846249 isoform X2 [Odontomachus brunneus]